MRYLLIDRILEWNASKSIRGIKNIAMSEDFLEYHFPGNPVMPGVLLLEAMTQLAGWLEAASSNFQNWFLLSNVRSCKFYGFSLPGDQVELTAVRAPESDRSSTVYHGTALVEGKRRVSAEFEGIIVPLSELEDVNDQRKIFMLLRRER